MILFFIGLISGIIGGMGIGGGTILIPGLILFSQLNQQQAQGINLIVFIPTAIIALITHSRNKNIETKIIIPLIVSGLLGSILGSILAINITSNVLKKLFAIFLLFMGMYEIFSKSRK